MSPSKDIMSTVVWLDKFSEVIVLSENRDQCF